MKIPGWDSKISKIRAYITWLFIVILFRKIEGLKLLLITFNNINKFICTKSKFNTFYQSYIKILTKTICLILTLTKGILLLTYKILD